MLYYSVFDSHLNFGNLLWGSADNKLLNKIENIQKKCIRNIGLKHFRAYTEPIFKQMEILKFTDKLAYCRSYTNTRITNYQSPFLVFSEI